MSKTAFILEFSDLARTTSARCGVLPEIVLAQSALETGWGLDVPNNNYFGIKGPGGSFSTREFINGKWVVLKQSFVGYATPADSFAGYASLILRLPRYAAFRKATTMAAQAAALGKSGYATAPTYGAIVLSIAKGIIMAPGGGAGI